MVVRRCGAPRALLLSVAALLGCRGEAKEKEADRPVAPADEKLAWPAIDEASLTGWAATGGFTLGAPVPLAITPDGAVLFRRSKPRDPAADLYQLDPAGKVTVLASAATLLASAPVPSGVHAPAAPVTPITPAPSAAPTPAAPPASAASPAPGGIETIDVSGDGARVLVPLVGRLFVIERPTGASRELAVGAHRDPRMSPDGKRVAFVRDGDLWVAPIGEPGAPHASPIRLTQHPPDREYATPEVVAREFGRQRGYWWSPDSQSIVFQRTDAHAVDTLYLGDPRHPEKPPAAVKYPRSGKTNAMVDLGIVPAGGGTPRWVTWDLARYPYLARAIWPAKGPLTLIVVGRTQTVLAVLAVDLATGSTRPLLTEADPTWLNIAPEPLTWLPDGSGFLWMTERHGIWSLEHQAADGSHVRQVLPPDVGLRRVAGVSPDGREAIVEAASDAREQHVWRVPLAGGAPIALTSPDSGGVHHAFSGHGVVVLTSEMRGGGRVTAAVRGDGTRVELPSVGERTPLVPTTKLEKVVLNDHAQYAAVTRPRAFDAQVRYPVLLRVADELGGKGVLDALDTYWMDQWFADAGFIVVRSDGRGTPGHDHEYERAIAGDVLTLPMNDQIGAVKQLGARYPELDRSRVGLVGTAFGGYLATLGALIHPDAFAAAVAVSPITDWELLDTAGSERYMKTVDANAAGYRRTNASTYAEQLKQPLLILSSVTDDRIHFTHTMALVEALSAAGKQVELATLSAKPDTARKLLDTKLQLAFLREHLGPPVRPQVMPAPRGEGEEEEEERERERARGHTNDDRNQGRGDKDRGDKDRGDKDRGDKDRR
ncbi:MAG TPA: DPP IV N-terminal domain-containing protein [Kofleriaceae bacterium]|jgi:dipeptidyl-peptidase-4|nr:DPP IV N-terminal domain-containing protein [Kofleriaceae bacterium]